MVNILVVEDDQLVARTLRATLEAEGYQVTTVLNGKDAVQFALKEMPQLIVLNIQLHWADSNSLFVFDGYEFISRLRNHPKSMHIPILALSSSTTAADKILAYDCDVDGYITMPFDVDELLAQVRRQLRRVEQNCLSPLTGLPGGLQVVRAINHKLGSTDPWSILYLDLDNFKAFNDVYGFLTGNEMILLVGRTCKDAVYEFGNSDDFVGHVGGDDFVVVTTPDRASHLCKQISTQYKEKSAALYRSEDLRRGSISGVDRKGRPYQFPLISLSIGVVNNQICRPHSIQEVSYLAAEAKRNAKQSTSNISYISLQRDRGYAAERSSVAGSPSFFLYPPSFSFAMNGHALQDLMYFTGVDSFAEYEQQVY
jgi:diguanylate cyclase (GGDEF)-like protein